MLTIIYESTIELSVNPSSHIRDHWSQISTTYKIMKKLEIVQEWPKCDTGAESEQMLLGKLYQQAHLMQGVSTLFAETQTFNLAKKKSALPAKHNKTSSTCIIELSLNQNNTPK